MKRASSPRLSVLSHCLMLTLLCPSILAQTASDDWSLVRQVKPGTKLMVKTKTGQKRQGDFKTMTDDSLTLSDAKSPGQEITIRRDEIAEIRKKSGTQTAVMAALMGGVGFAGGYGIGYGIGEAKNSRYEPEYPMAVVGAAAGAVVGAIIGSRGQVIYRGR